MLSISPPMRGGGSGDYYLKLARHEYYTKSLGQPGEWFGKGAVRLGLEGDVEPETLRNLLEGRSPDGSKSLIQIQNWKNRERQSGWDQTFSPPKSFGTLWSQSDDQLRARLEAMQQAAVKKAVSFLEDEVGTTRRGHGGRIREKADLIFAMFLQGTSRANEPQPHTHVVLINLSIRQDGSTGTLWSKGFFEKRRAADAIYKTELAEQLRQGLNLEIIPTKHGFEIKDVPQKLCRAFSSRHRDIEAAMEKETDKSAKNAARIALKTRPPKHELPAEQLFAKWRETGRQFGWGPEQAKALLEESAKRHAEHPQQLSPVKITISRDKQVVGKISRRELLSLIKDAEKRQQKMPEPTPTGERQSDSGEREKGAQTQTKDEPKTRAKKTKAAKNHRRAAGRKPESKPDQRDSSREFNDTTRGARPKRFIRFESRWLAPRAPKFSPLYNVRIPVLVVGERKTKNWWGKVHFSINTPLGKLQFRDKRLFPRAPEWSPLKNAMLPRLVLLQNTQWKWRKIIWKKNTAFGQLQLRHKALFPHAIAGSPAHKLSIPAFRLQTKRPERHYEDRHKQKHHH
jgi:conjugative relaxase-like TrwC/TraI family protein